MVCNLVSTAYTSARKPIGMHRLSFWNTVGLAALSVAIGGCPESCAPGPSPNPPNVSATDLNFANMRGTNVFSPSASPLWFGQAKDLQYIPEMLNLNHVRLPVDLTDTAMNHTEAELVESLESTLDTMAVHHQKAIILLAGYTYYDREQPNDPYPPFYSFLGVEETARQVVEGLKGHPALFAWELMNEATGSNLALVCNDSTDPDAESVNRAVHEMYTLVHEIDPTTPTTVSEAWYYWCFDRWMDVMSFASYHEYPQLTSPLDRDRLECAQARLATDITCAREQVAPLPLVIGEFGILNSALTEDEQATFYRAMYSTLRRKNIGSLFWSLSLDDAYSVISSDKSLRKPALAIQTALMPGAGPLECGGTEPCERGRVPAPGDTCLCGLPRGQGLAAGEAVSSCDKRFVLTMQEDGNLVLSRIAPFQEVLWSAGLSGIPDSFVNMQCDGNLVMGSIAAGVTWSTGTSGHPDAFLVVQDDGNAVIYGSQWEVLWQAGTGGQP